MNDTATPPAAPIFKRKKLLTRPVLKLDVGIVQYIKVESAVYIGKEIQSKRGRPTDNTEAKKEPAHILDCIDLAHNYEPSQIIVNAVLLGVLKDNYPGDTYVGKCFAIEKLNKRPGKDYFPFKVEEIEDPQGETTAPSAGTSPAMASTDAVAHGAGAGAASGKGGIARGPR